MTSDQTWHHRHSIRLKGYDYSQCGLYFITLCTKNRIPLFGEIDTDEMQLNEAGAMVQSGWERIPEKFPQIFLDGFVLMPNHVHGIIGIGDDNAYVGAPLVGALDDMAVRKIGCP